MIVCLDTNVLVSGIFWSGVPGKILDHWVKNDFDLIASAPILDEYIRVLRRIAVIIGVDLGEQWITKIIENCAIVALPHSLRRWSRDPTDDKFLQCAFIGHAHYLVTGDRDLLILKDTGPITIVTPREFLKIL